jgi:hypothetical protein
MCHNSTCLVTKMSFKDALITVKLRICLIFDWNRRIFFKGLSECILLYLFLLLSAHL